MKRKFKNPVYVDITKYGADESQLESLARMIGVRMSASIARGPVTLGNCILIDVKVEDGMTSSQIASLMRRQQTVMSNYVEAEVRRLHSRADADVSISLFV